MATKIETQDNNNGDEKNGGKYSETTKLLLPPISAGKEKTIVLDMDYTLLRVDTFPLTLYDCVCPIDIGEAYLYLYFTKRGLWLISFCKN